ncbi:MAG: hypothetical protein QM493_06500 [Sulfurovum sp.]
MKKFIRLAFLGLAVIVFTGCGAVVDDGGNNGVSINIYDLTYGYSIEGYNDFGQNVTLEYCGSDYRYYRGSEYFEGSFNINGSGIVVNMWDDDGGSYIIDSNTGYLEVGYNYYIYDVSDDITITNILTLSC